MTLTSSKRSVAVVAAVAFVSAACGSPSLLRAGAPTSGAQPTCIARVTPDCTGYSYATPSPGTVVVTAPKSSGGNNREFFWGRNGRRQADATVCATFDSGRGIDQQGVIVRLNSSPNGGVTGISVTRNIWLDVFDVFNFHVWSTAKDPASPFTQFGSVVVRDLPVTPAVYPLSMCVRTVAATDVIQFVVWTRGQAPPKWGSARQGGEAHIPAAAPSTGLGGWFAGHLDPGTTMTYTDLRVDGRVPTGLP
jgi:hypothetical protein